MKRVVVLFLVIFASGETLIAATHVSGDIGGRTFEPSGNPYVIDQDVIVPKNTMVVLKAGTVFLFTSFTGITVYGSLLVEGTMASPVIFSSINDANQNPAATQLPNAFDWNGIYVSEESGDVKFRNFHLMFSVFGIKSKKDQITIQNGQFKQNGQFHFTINDNIHYVQDNISYSYNVDKSAPGANSNKPRRKVVKEKAPREKKPELQGRRVAAISALSIGGITGITFVITGVKALRYQNDMNEIKRDPNPLDGPRWNTLEKKYDSIRPVCITTGVIAGVTLPVSLFLFIKKDTSTMIQKVSLNFMTGYKSGGVGFTHHF